LRAETVASVNLFDEKLLVTAWASRFETFWLWRYLTGLLN